ncbi:MAG: WG repeat-containing protein [Bacteroidales bacterium]|nr:WG repeat-containing protein [Bacteroidales bacterium]
MKRYFIFLFSLFSLICSGQTEKLELIIAADYDEIVGFSEGVSWARKDGLWGAINTKGGIVIPFKFQIPGEDCSNDRINVGEEKAFYNSRGEKVFTYEIDAYSFSESLSVILLDREGRYQVVSTYGDVIFKGKDGQIAEGTFHDGLMVYMDTSSGLFGYVNTKGENAIPAKFNDALPFSEGLAVVMNEDGKYGFIDRTGQLVIPFSFNQATSFSDGYAWCESNDVGCFIDKYGSIKIKNREYAEFKSGLCIVRPSSSDPESYRQFDALIIDKEGNALFASTNYNQTLRVGNNNFLLGFEDGWAILDESGNQLSSTIPYSNYIYKISSVYSDVIIVSNTKTKKCGAVKLHKADPIERRPGESNAAYIQRMARLGYGIK